MAIGIFIISILLFYAFSASPTFDKFSKASSAGLVSKYQYILKSPVPLEAIGSDSGATSDSGIDSHSNIDSGSSISSHSNTDLESNNASDSGIKQQAEKFTISSGSVYMLSLIHI